MELNEWNKTLLRSIIRVAESSKIPGNRIMPQSQIFQKNPLKSQFAPKNREKVKKTVFLAENARKWRHFFKNHGKIKKNCFFSGELAKKDLIFLKIVKKLEYGTFFFHAHLFFLSLQKNFWLNQSKMLSKDFIYLYIFHLKLQ